MTIQETFFKEKIMAAFYTIRIAGRLDPSWSEWLQDLTITPLDSGETLLSGTITDQAGLLGVLNRLRDMNLEILSLEKAGARGTPAIR